jgi:succinate-semialdehyde dehydrogenase / glutarate-semialdehyde dehydrogenase
MPFHAIDPTTGRSLYETPALDAAERDALIQRVHVAQQRWRTITIAERARFVSALGDALTRHRESLALALTSEMGKPITAARAEVDKCVLLCEQAPAMAFPALAAETLVDDSAAVVSVRYDALGVVLAVMPWNFPYWQALRFAVPALLAGNGVIIKPAPSVPASARWLQQCLDDARRASTSATTSGELDAGAPCDVALIDLDAIDAVIADPRIVGVTLTGSDRAGRHVAQVAGAHLKKVVLELGGSDPFIVLPDADIARAASVAVSARTVNTGQSCIAAKRFIVCDAVYDEFLERFTAGMGALVMGDPRDEHTQIGPIATASVRDGLAAQVRTSLAHGARAVLGGDATGFAGYFFPPTVLVDVPLDAPAACDELFGPVAAVFRVRDADAAIALANASPYGLGASVWTRDAALAERCVAALDAGMVFVNDMVVSDPRYPFGGVKRSGIGRELGPIGFREFTNQKSVRIRRPLTDPR